MTDVLKSKTRRENVRTWFMLVKSLLIANELVALSCGKVLVDPIYLIEAGIRI